MKGKKPYLPRSKTQLPHLIRRFRQARHGFDRFCIAQYGMELTPVACEVVLFLEAWRAHRMGRISPKLASQMVEEYGLKVLACILVCAENKLGNPFRELAVLIEHGIEAPEDMVRARLALQAHRATKGGAVRSAKELQAIAGDSGSLRAFRRKIKEAGCPVRNERGKGGGRPRKHVTRNGTW